MKLYLYLLLIAAIGAFITVAILKQQSKSKKKLPPEEFESRFGPARNNGENEYSDTYGVMRKLMSPDESGDPTSSVGYNDFLAEKITDPAMAKKIIQKSPRKYFRAYEHFAKVITDEKDLEELLLNWKDEEYSDYHFLRKISNHDILLNLARNAPLIRIRYNAAEKLGDHALMDAIIEENPVEFQTRMENVQEPEVLRRIAQNESLPDKVRLSAAVFLNDETLIQTIAEKMDWNFDCEHIIRHNLDRFSDDMLLNIIKDRPALGAEAVKHIKNTFVLDEIAEQNENEAVRVAAYRRSPKYSSKLKENHIYLQDLHSEDTKIRQNTADRLISLAETDPETLLPIWDYLKKTIEEPVSSSRSNWYDREEAGYYNESGIGRKFPDKPGQQDRNGLSADI